MVLTIKRRRFAKYYAQSGNATQAVIDAGYQVKSRAVARVIGHELVQVPAVMQEVEGQELFLESQIIPSIETLTGLRDESKSDRIKLATAVKLLYLAGVNNKI